MTGFSEKREKFNNGLVYIVSLIPIGNMEEDLRWNTLEETSQLIPVPVTHSQSAISKNHKAAPRRHWK